MSSKNTKGRLLRTAPASILLIPSLYSRSGYSRSGSHDILGLQSLGAPLHLELHLRTFFQSAISIHLDRREVNEHIIAVRALDEAIALGGVKPFHSPFFSHYCSPSL